DDSLDRRVVVSRLDDEVRRMPAHVLVLGLRQLETLRTAGVAALAEDGQLIAFDQLEMLAQAFDSFVDLAKERLPQHDRMGPLGGRRNSVPVGLRMLTFCGHVSRPLRRT